MCECLWFVRSKHLPLFLSLRNFIQLREAKTKKLCVCVSDNKPGYDNVVYGVPTTTTTSFHHHLAASLFDWNLFPFVMFAVCVLVVVPLSVCVCVGMLMKAEDTKYIIVCRP